MLRKYGKRFAKYNKLRLAFKLVSEKGVKLAMQLNKEKKTLHKQEEADKRHYKDLLL